MLRPWAFRIAIERASSVAIYLQIAHAVIEGIQRGRIPGGSAMPGTRELAETLGVNRKTVVLAYEELVAQGWLVSQRKRGTFVSPELPVVALKTFALAQPRPAAPARPRFHPSGPARRIPVYLPEPGVLTFDDGAPDTRLIPVNALAGAYRGALLTATRRNRLGYGDPRGTAILRQAVSTMLNRDRGLATTPERICLTRGSQMAIYLAARVLVSPGDVIAIEELSYPPAREAFRAAGAIIAPIDVDAQGLRVDQLDELCSRQRIQAVYTTPHHQFPTTVMLAPERRLRLLELAERHNFTIIEDDYDHEFHFSHQPLLPLASADVSGKVVYIGSFSKLLMPSLRSGYLVASADLVEQLASEILLVDRQGDPATELAVAELIDSGEIRRHARKALRVYAGRRELFATLLRQHFSTAVDFELPDGGLAFWVRFDPQADLVGIQFNAKQHGVWLLSGRVFSASERAVPAARLGFASLDPGELAEAVRRLAHAVKATRKTSA